MSENENIKTGPNYITLINRFWMVDIEAGFSHLEVHLFFKLLEINNRLGWKETFRYPNSRLQSEVGARQKNLIAARQKLIEKGLIGYEKGTTREAGIYQLLSDGMTKESNQGTNCNNYFQNNFQKEEQKKVIRGTLNRIDKNKQDKREKKKFISPTLNEFIEYFKKYGYPKSLAEKAWKGYDEANWHDSKGNKILNWKQKSQHVWFKDENLPKKELKTNTSLAPGQILKNENYKAKEEWN